LHNGEGAFRCAAIAKEKAVDELVQRLMDRANLSREQAERAANVVADFLREHATGGQLQDFVGRIPGLSQHADKIPDDIGNRAADFVGGFFGKKEPQ
jgi:hypothetical protein